MKAKKRTRAYAAVLAAACFFPAVLLAAGALRREAAGSDLSKLFYGREEQVQSPPAKVTGQPRKLIDILSLAGAPTSQWTNGNVWLPFPGSDTDPRGFACIRENAELEDASLYPKVLETHPEWRDEHGLIVGIFRIAKLPAKAVFKAEVGLLKGASQSDGVKFRVYARKDPSFDASTWCAYDGKLDLIGLSLDRYAGQEVELVLEVHVLKTSTQDWAVWVSPRVEWE
jgi:hypothetical protein